MWTLLHTQGYAISVLLIDVGSDANMQLIVGVEFFQQELGRTERSCPLLSPDR